MGLVRFLLALTVVTAHVGSLPFSISLGSLLAVQCFFIISGFLIAMVWTSKYQEQPNGLRLFYSARAARIYFLYWVVLAIAILVAHIIKLAIHDYPPYFGSIARPLLPFTIFTNGFLFGSSWAYWLGFDNGFYFTSDWTTSPFPVWSTMIIGPAWTLDLELTFYLLAPFLINLKLRYILAIIVVSTAARFVCYSLGYDHDPWNYRFFPFEIGVFLLGVLAYRLSRIVTWRPSPEILTLIFAAIVWSIMYTEWLWPLRAFHSFGYLIVFAAAIPYVFALTRSWKLDGFLADMSFPLYLVHWIVSAVCASLRSHVSMPWPQYPGLIAAILSIVAAALLVIFVERPIERWRHAKIGIAGARSPPEQPLAAAHASRAV